ncbi:MAG: type II secretion system protein GspG [Myxococcales bacterium]|nr:type II secretion system protein GspG [Myxococcales bacterium]MCB9669499.1 type II secretion system protein GspG [Alphaproteobacteria bacterium]MCB9692118.1 type II secretion system protein GspG [Alphaproteobacteria bacterium]
MHLTRDWRDLTRDPRLHDLLRSRKGMSLVEVMVVIVIILTLTGVLTYGVMTVFGQSQADTTRLMMGKVAQQIEIYGMRKGYPGNSDGLDKVFPDGMPKDSWDNEFIYVTPGPNGKKFDLISLGSDGTEGGTGTAEDLKYSDSLK